MRLDINETLPSGMKEYLSYYGWHFSKKMCEWASDKMYNKKGKIVPYTKDTFKALTTKYGMDIDCTYDAIYIANMCKADFFGSAISDEPHLILYVKNVVEDADAYEGMIFTRFYADCIGSGTPIDWEDML